MAAPVIDRLRRRYALMRSRMAVREYTRWSREAAFLWKALGEPSDEWRTAEIRSARAMRDFEYWTRRAFPDRPPVAAAATAVLRDL